MTTAQPVVDNKNNNTNKKQHPHRHERNAPRNANANRPQLRRSVNELVAQPPNGYTVTVHELDPNAGQAKKRVRLLVLESDNGWRFLLFMSIRIDRTTRTEGATLMVNDDLDILPTNIVETSIEVNLLNDDALQTLSGLVSEFRERQKTVVPAHKRPFVQRPFERKLANMQIEEEEDMAKKSIEKAGAKQELKVLSSPKKTSAHNSDWWFAAAC